MAEEEKPFDAGDQKAVEHKVKEAKARELKKSEFLKAAMIRPDGRTWFYDFLKDCGIGRNPFSPDNDRLTAFSCGELNVGQKVYADLTENCPHEYLLMMEENSG